jgi:cyclase
MPTIERLGERVFVVTGNYFDEHMTVIATGDGLVVVDTLASPAATLEGREMIEEMSHEPVRYLVNTHLNDDHHAGNQHFRDATIIGHSNCRNHLDDVFLDKPDNIRQVKALLADLESQLDSFDPASRDAARYRIYLDGYASLLESFEGFVFTPPTLYLEAGATIALGDLSIQILDLGPGHTDSDLAVYVPDERLLVAGDLVLGSGYVPVIHTQHGGSFANLTRILDELLGISANVEHLVPGHGSLTDRKAIEAQQAYLLALQTAVVDSRKRGLTLEEASSHITLDEFQDYLLYEFAHANNVQAAWVAEE